MRNWIRRALVTGLISGVTACAQAEPFSVVVLPDTQTYSESFPDTFEAQTQWIIDNLESQKIVFVTHLGDLVSAPDKPEQWAVATKAMSLLDGQVPFSVSSGNHDIGPLNLFDKSFGTERFRKQAGYLASSPNGRSHLQKFSAGGYTLLHLNLETDAENRTPADAVAWARQALAKHPGLPTILSTHTYMGTAKRLPNGQMLWDELVTSFPQIFMVISGNTHGEFRQVSTNAAGKQVLEMLCDYQDGQNGGDGYLRILRLAPEEGQLSVVTYSPTTGRRKEGRASGFNVPLTFGKDGSIAVAMPATAPRGGSAVAATPVPAPSPQPVPAPAPAPVPVPAPAPVPVPAMNPVVNPGAGSVVVRRFQSGKGGYTSTVDTQIRADQPAASFAADPRLVVDQDDDNTAPDAQPVYALIRFDGLFGDGPAQIKPGSQIRSAKLRLHTGNQTNDTSAGVISVGRMSSAWRADATWALWGSRLQTVLAAPEAQAPASAEDQWVEFDVTGSVKGWSLNPKQNFGWLVSNNGTDGWRFDLSESPDVNRRPELVIEASGTK